MAMRRTGGEKTDELLGKNGSGPEGLPHSIIVTPDGVEGEVPEPVAEAPAEVRRPSATPRTKREEPRTPSTASAKKAEGQGAGRP